MTTPDPTSKPRLRIIDDTTRPDPQASGKDHNASAKGGVTPEQAAAFAALVAEADQGAVAHTLEQMGAEQLRSLAMDESPGVV